MRHFIIADNQELTRQGLEALVRRKEQSTVYRTTDKTGLMQLLKEHEGAVVILDYMLFDFVDVEQLLIISERYELARWVLISNEYTPAFLQKVIYTSHLFSIVYKDSPLRDIREAVEAAVRHQRFISQRALEEIIILAAACRAAEPADLDGARDCDCHRKRQVDEGDCCRAFLEHSHHHHPPQEHLPEVRRQHRPRGHQICPALRIG